MNIQEYLHTCRELSRFCSQNGWIDNDTLEVEVVEEGPQQVLASVQFEEILMEGAGCVAGRVPCFGQVRMRLDDAGHVVDMSLIE